MPLSVSNKQVFRLAAVIVVVLVLSLVPAPLLPPHHFAEILQSQFGLGWKASYFLAVVGLQFAFYCSIGILSAFVVKRGVTLRERLLQMMIVPLTVVGLAILIRSYKLGHWPVLIHVSTIVGITACFIGVWIGLGILYQRWKFIVLIVPTLLGVSVWGLLGSGMSATLTRSTEVHLQRLVAAGSHIPAGDARFGALMRIAFSRVANEGESEIQHNRAAILALGIALGDENIARFVGLDSESKLLKDAALLREGTTIREREDWPRHFCVSASLAVLENPLISDAGGLIKEQLDALTKGSGFSFCDIAADRAGVRFAEAATYSERDAIAMQDLLQNRLSTSNFLPAVADLPENLTTEQFSNIYGSVGSDSYQLVIDEIERRLDSSIALSPLHSGNTP